jgi:hypothetical protein
MVIDVWAGDFDRSVSIFLIGVRLQVEFDWLGVFVGNLNILTDLLERFYWGRVCLQWLIPPKSKTTGLY